ncbi:hypothetical protein, partial [Legionella rubrilucens]
DDSVRFPHVKVGHRQGFILKRLSRTLGRFFCLNFCWNGGNTGLYLTPACPARAGNCPLAWRVFNSKMTTLARHSGHHHPGFE